ncbi:hypothetical protein J4212_02395 [Candidatus Woesearchaeota archaeon]|nr:hypothetical protein [Candidatus Woesearchaeota archaeon]
MAPIYNPMSVTSLVELVSPYLTQLQKWYRADGSTIFVRGEPLENLGKEANSVFKSGGKRFVVVTSCESLPTDFQRGISFMYRDQEIKPRKLIESAVEEEFRGRILYKALRDLWVSGYGFAGQLIMEVR